MRNNMGPNTHCSILDYPPTCHTPHLLRLCGHPWLTDNPLTTGHSQLGLGGRTHSNYARLCLCATVNHLPLAMYPTYTTAYLLHQLANNLPQPPYLPLHLLSLPTCPPPCLPSLCISHTESALPSWPKSKTRLCILWLTLNIAYRTNFSTLSKYHYHLIYLSPTYKLSIL